MYIKYRLSNGTIIKVMAPGWMPGPIDTETQARAFSEYNDLLNKVSYAYSTGTLFEGYYNVTMIGEQCIRPIKHLLDR
jgi:hypothetical protein